MEASLASQSSWEMILVFKDVCFTEQETSQTVHMQGTQEKNKTGYTHYKGLCVSKF